jgi:hypothetical protein
VSCTSRRLPYGFTMGDVRIGAVTISRDKAWHYARTYLTDQSRAWAYPAYDGFTGGGDPNSLDDADLLAPVLLNVRVTLRGFYGLRAQRVHLGEILAGIPRNADLTDDKVDLAPLGALYSVLDAPGIIDVSGTTLAKILHRMRPRFVPLYDEYVRRCYQDGDAAPVQRAKGRTWERFMILLAGAMRDDLRRAPDFWADLAGLATNPKITPLRAIDIVAWSIGRALPARP